VFLVALNFYFTCIEMISVGVENSCYPLKK
jgi:hypothetical protein